MAPRDGDGLGMAPRPGEPESALLPGMAAPRPPGAKISPVERFGLFGHVQLGSMPDTSGPGPVALETPLLWNYDFDPASGNARAQFSGLVLINGVPVVTGGVASFNTRTGAVTLQLADVTAVGGAPIASPTFTGVPAAPTPALGTNTTQLATMAAIQAAIAAGGQLGAVTAVNGTFSNSVATANVITNYTAQSGNTGSWLNLVTGRYTPPAGRYFIMCSTSIQAPVSGNGTATMGIRKNGAGIAGPTISSSGSTSFAMPMTIGAYVDANGTDIFDFYMNPAVAGMNPQGNACFTAFAI